MTIKNSVILKGINASSRLNVSVGGFVGGFTLNVPASLSLINSSNKGPVFVKGSGTAFSGGFVGSVYSYSVEAAFNSIIGGCWNSANIISENSNNSTAGGFVGVVSCEKATMSFLNCSNDEAISVSSHDSTVASGIIGVVNSNNATVNMNRVRNKGDIKSADTSNGQKSFHFASGLVVFTQKKVDTHVSCVNCENLGDINGDSMVAGFFLNERGTRVEVANSINKGIIHGKIRYEICTYAQTITNVVCSSSGPYWGASSARATYDAIDNNKNITTIEHDLLEALKLDPDEVTIVVNVVDDETIVVIIYTENSETIQTIITQVDDCTQPASSYSSSFGGFD